MINRTCIALSAALLMLAAPCATAETAKPFDMFGLTTTDTYSGEMIVGGKKCKLKGQGEETCSRFGGAKIGTTLIMNLTAKFNDGKFYTIAGATYITAAGDLKAAFIAKYGPPSNVTATEWQNQLGSTFPNEISQWVFADGVLTFRERGEQRDFPDFSFVASKNAPLKSAQPLNF